MKVLFVTREYPPFVIGGVATHTFNLVKHLEKLGVDCKVISFGDEKESSEKILFLNPNSYIVEKGKASLASTSRIPLDIIRFSKKTNELIKDGDFDIVHIEEPYLGALIKPSSKSTVKVSTFHDTSYGEIKSILRYGFNASTFKRILFYISLGFFLEFNCIASSKALIVPTPQIKNELISKYKVSAGKIKIIRNGVDIPILEEGVKREIAKKRLGINPENTLIFNIARMVGRKRLDLLIKAVKVLHNDKFNKLQVVIAGDGPERQKLLGLVKAYSLDDIIKMPGWVSTEERNLYYQATDIFTLPSDYEGFPLTLLEAMSYGAAVVNSKIDSLCSMQDGIDGLVFSAGDYVDLSGCLRQLLIDCNLRNQLSQSSRCFAEKYDWKAVAQETIQFYNYLST